MTIYSIDYPHKAAAWGGRHVRGMIIPALLHAIPRRVIKPHYIGPHLLRGPLKGVTYCNQVNESVHS